MNSTQSDSLVRRGEASQLDLFGAVTVGVGAIVGGGVMVLAGPAFAAAGPSAALAFALNGGVALLTAMSFAEMASAFPESGGTYMFAKKVLSVRWAFVTGWFVWFAYIVAGVLYALGFGTYGIATLSYAARALGFAGPFAWDGAASYSRGLGLLATVFYAGALMRSSSGGGRITTWGKVVLFAFLIGAGVIVFVTGKAPPIGDSFRPFFAGGALGLVSTMGLTFIALQGFEIIATVAGEIEQPERRVPRAMFLSVAIALAVYIPLLVVITAVGVPRGEHVATVAQRSPDTLFAMAIENYLGAAGYWLVLVVAMMATLSALHANILAASRIARRMAQDRTLPWVLGIEHPKHGSPAAALFASALAIAALLMMIGDLGAAGAAASLIFLLSFVFAHGTAYLARARGLERENAYHSPAFPLVPLAGGLVCAALALFQALTVMQAGVIAVVWLGIGALLYLSLFGRRAEIADAVLAAQDQELSKLRGADPILLVPISNPANAASMAQVASAMLPPNAGQLWLLSIVPSQLATRSGRQRLDDCHHALSNALVAALAIARRPDCLISVGDDPWAAIRGAVRARGCGALLLGLGDIEVPEAQHAIEDLLARLTCDLAVLRASGGFDLPSVRKVVVPVHEGAAHDHLRARLVAGIQRVCAAQVVYLAVLPSAATDALVAQAERHLGRVCEDEVSGPRSVIVERGSTIVDGLLRQCDESTLVVLELSRIGKRQLVFGELVLEVARRHSGSLLVVGKR